MRWGEGLYGKENTGKLSGIWGFEWH
jgi:hypothetical protein